LKMTPDYRRNVFRILRAVEGEGETHKTEDFTVGLWRFGVSGADGAGSGNFSQSV